MTPGFFQITLKVFLHDGSRIIVLRDKESQEGDLPGGRISKEEIYKPWTESIEREIKEELGPDVKVALHPEPLFILPHWIKSGGHEAVAIFFRADFKGGNIQLSDEHDRMAWVDLASFDASTWFSDHLLAGVERYQKTASPAALSL
ncbi:MAG: NUDIX domain-containing protein [Spirochaetia bacterium]|nr:NUDIX domain-containing protein [Spirochaetia bacterium]